jgi:hypothetical protein
MSEEMNQGSPHPEFKTNGKIQTAKNEIGEEK